MLRNVHLNRTIWLITFSLALLASLLGLLNQEIYTGLTSEEYTPEAKSKNCEVENVVIIIHSFNNINAICIK